MSFEQPYASPGHYQQTPYDEPKHSGFGIASFALSILLFVGLFGLIGFAGFVEATDPGAMENLDEESPITVLIGLAVIFGIFVNLMGLVFGIIGACQQNRKKVFAFLGIAFNSLVILLVLGLMVLGLAVEA